MEEVLQLKKEKGYQNLILYGTDDLHMQKTKGLKIGFEKSKMAEAVSNLCAK
jgi:hypothetical protein